MNMDPGSSLVLRLDFADESFEELVKDSRSRILPLLVTARLVEPRF